MYTPKEEKYNIETQKIKLKKKWNKRKFTTKTPTFVRDTKNPLIMYL